jgi:hypothetical protein
MVRTLRLNSKLRGELLNGKIFYTLKSRVVPDFKGQLIRRKIPGNSNYWAEANPGAYPVLTQDRVTVSKIQEVLDFIGAP